MLLRHIWDGPGEEKLQEKLLFDLDVTETIALGRVTVEPGGSTQVGFHTDEEEIYVILSGKAILMIGNEKQEVGAGDVAYVPRNNHHQMVCISEESLQYLYFANWPKQ
jgi:mannose-6-phosphate isomerase-like protein (cupin superfamily)